MWQGFLQRKNKIQNIWQNKIIITQNLGQLMSFLFSCSQYCQKSDHPKEVQKLTTNEMFVDFTHTTHLIVSRVVAWTQQMSNYGTNWISNFFHNVLKATLTIPFLNYKYLLMCVHTSHRPYGYPLHVLCSWQQTHQNP